MAIDPNILSIFKYIHETRCNFKLLITCNVKTFQNSGSVESNELEEGPLRILRNANHHDHSDPHHAKEDLFDRAARVGLRIIDGKDREGANDLGNDLDFLGHHHHDHLHQQEVEEIRKLLNSGVSLGELFSTSIVRTTTPKAQITESTVSYEFLNDVSNKKMIDSTVALTAYKFKSLTFLRRCCLSSLHII